MLFKFSVILLIFYIFVLSVTKKKSNYDCGFVSLLVVSFFTSRFLKGCY